MHIYQLIKILTKTDIQLKGYTDVAFAYFDLDSNNIPCYKYDNRHISFYYITNQMHISSFYVIQEEI